MNGERFQVLLLNELARTSRIPTRHAPFGEHTLRIPTRDYHALCMLFPGLRSKNFDERQAAEAALQASPFADPYRVRPRKAQGAK